MEIESPKPSTDSLSINSNIRKIRRVFIPNRTEIALRIARACIAREIEPVLGVSETDKQLTFASGEYRSVVIGGARASDSYLNIDSIVSIAKREGCDALHPGYGFLSENSIFAQAVIDAGIIFVGPNPNSISLLGDKIQAKKVAIDCGVPVSKSVEFMGDDETFVRDAIAVGLPLIIKSVSGGGGRGMRIVRSEVELRESIPLARAESKKFFGTDQIYCERFIERPRHVEVQILGDCFGNVVHLGTRDCSTQRRNQKVIEEAPAPDLSDEVRDRLTSSAVAIAKRVGYASLGTAEFLVKDGEIFFLEINTRLQVEHPVTEQITGLDLVDLQLAIAEGERLPFDQTKIDEVLKVGSSNVHSIEFRLYAEDPENGFNPDGGVITEFTTPKYPFLREECGYRVGDKVPLSYDAMLSKLIITAPTRAEALNLSLKVLNDTKVEGVTTNVSFLKWMLRFTTICASPLDIGFIQSEFSIDSSRLVLGDFQPDNKHQCLTSSNGLVAEKIDTCRYLNKGTGKEMLVYVFHCENRLFYAVPEFCLKGLSISLTSVTENNAHLCRASNGFDRALKALCEEVLEKNPSVF